MAELIDESSSIESTTIGVYRTSATVKGGRRFSFSSLVVVGDRHGRIGVGYAKSNQVPQAIEKAQKVAKRKMRGYPLIGRTIPHAVTGKFGACTVRMLPASPGTGVIAGAAVRGPLELLGVQDCLTKCFGSTNPKNVVKAVLHGLEQLRSREVIEELRGIALGKSMVEESVERGRELMGSASNLPRAAAPKNTVGQDERGSRGRRPGRRPRRGGESTEGGGGGEGAPATGA